MVAWFNTRKKRFGKVILIVEIVTVSYFANSDFLVKVDS